jgi:hypothetical protein
MRHELTAIVRDLKAIVRDTPPGPLRDRMELDLVNLRARLALMPERVARQGAMRSKDEIERILAAELRFCFADVMAWSKR